jgi:methylmalonyl-CoA/ethylmalonyl-CoA epimerase
MGFAVRRLSEAVPRWERSLGASAGPAEEVVSQKVRVQFIEVGSTHLELLEPTIPDSAVGRFIASRGEGMHHIAFAVPNVDRQLQQLADQGGRVIDHHGRPGARGRVVGFAHPSAFNGVLVEFVEAP